MMHLLHYPSTLQRQSMLFLVKKGFIMAMMVVMVLAITIIPAHCFSGPGVPSSTRSLTTIKPWWGSNQKKLGGRTSSSSGSSSLSSGGASIGGRGNDDGPRRPFFFRLAASQNDGGMEGEEGGTEEDEGGPLDKVKSFFSDPENQRDTRL